MSPRFGGLAARVATALALGTVVVAVVLWAGTIGVAALVALVAALAVAEFYGLTRHERRKPNEVFGVVAVALMPLAAAFFPSGGLIAVVTALGAASLLWHLVFKQVTIADTAMTVFGAVYVGLTLSHLVLLRELPHGVTLVLVTFVSVWANDVFAYFIGVAVGKHRMAADISPRKSWEGFVGGAVCSLLVWLAASSLDATPFATGLAPLWLAIIGVAVPLAASAGDLVESRFKREAAMKDSGSLLPGHGGFLDRFDSMIVVSMAVYYLVLASRAL